MNTLFDSAGRPAPFKPEDACDECGHGGGFHLGAHPDQDDLPGIFPVATCWAETLCLACIRDPKREASLNAERILASALAPFRLPGLLVERARIERAVDEDNWDEKDRAEALAAVLLCGVCGEPGDVRDPHVRAFHQTHEPEYAFGRNL
jgi:hypothetical protein